MARKSMMDSPFEEGPDAAEPFGGRGRKGKRGGRRKRSRRGRKSSRY